MCRNKGTKITYPNNSEQQLETHFMSNVYNSSPLTSESAQSENLEIIQTVVISAVIIQNGPYRSIQGPSNIGVFVNGITAFRIQIIT